jgi:hypothetical protein
MLSEPTTEVSKLYLLLCGYEICAKVTQRAGVTSALCLPRRSQLICSKRLVV